MRFALRCIVWLAILYHAILSERGDGLDPARVADATRRGIAGGVEAYCRRDPADCLAKAARASDLLAAGRTDAADASAGGRDIAGRVR